VFVMPTTIWSFMYFVAPQYLGVAIWIVLAAIACVLALRFALARGAFRDHYQLAMLVLVGGVFGPTGSAIMALASANGGSFLFAFFLIYFAFTALPGRCAVDRADLGRDHHELRHGIAVPARPDAGVQPDLLPAADVHRRRAQPGGVPAVLDERRARIELRGARDALFAEIEVAQKIQTLLLPREPSLPAT